MSKGYHAEEDKALHVKFVETAKEQTTIHWRAFVFVEM